MIKNIFSLTNINCAITNYYEEYMKIVITLFIIFIICCILILIPYIFSIATIKDQQKLSEYECGFEPFDNTTRLPFDVHFYIVGILFLIFDVEIALIFPWIYKLNSMSLYGIYSMIFFIIILTIGFIYEWGCGVLKI